jgi:myo-inositol-1(or 4)-monophosphatase
MQALLTIAVRAARKAGDFVIRESEHIKSIESKSQNDFVTNVDQAAEQLIMETISNAYPEHSFLCEESGESGDSDYQWVIDPIDGTTNYIRKIPHWAISIACKHKGRTQIAVVYDPNRGEMFTAVKGRGAQFDNKKMRVSQTKGLEHALIGTGFPFRNEKRLPEYLEIFSKMFPLCSDMRRAGSAALDLAYVAAGRLDGFWEFGLSPWDTAAGALLVEESGGMVADMRGNPNHEKGNSILAANPKAFKAMLKVINQKP